MKALLSLAFAALAFASSNSSCRCRPHEPCWPSPQEWNALNSSVDGNLFAVRPVAAPCHEGDPEACDFVTKQWYNSTWRAAQPGAVQWGNWESWLEHNQTCSITSPQTPCGQGRVSLYSVVAECASNIQEAVRFAKRHNLRLVIKNSGHDFLGRSTAPESLQILTNRMKNIQLSENFKPAGSPKNLSEGSAITIGAGVSLQDLYSAAGKKGKTVVAGASHTVGAAGGYIQGGGHSFLGPWKGMSTDNVLEYTVVTADGNLVIANNYQNTDLFWALRGGGGGTFGVVVTVTLRTFDEVPVVIGSLNVSTVAGDPNFWQITTDFFAALPAINDGAGGYYWIMPNVPADKTMNVSSLSIILIAANQTRTSMMDRLYAPFRSKLNATSGVFTQYESLAFPNIHTLLSELLLPGDEDTTSYNTILGSRLFSRDLLVSRDGPKKLVSALKKLKFGFEEVITGHIVAGGLVAKNGRTIESALNPAWRKAATHIDFGRSWPPSATLAQRDAIIRRLTDVEMPILKAVEGRKMGSYMNEANAYEPDFQTEFWGSNYPRLYQIKQKWDPSGLFIARKGVGSEDWDDAGLCRVDRRN
ncbi:6-hydroxy-D-nicotine oxidase [Aspergillus udagawae]|uniref:6-hydroxy-D-nicotine oxidase n=1 Tax=Aspergillus udagawae TaxID=91492 RepID=A0ABQ1AU01_9EURO|nr:6-hydroxy-D-nicotine oxidase [Aspergillus udagawae]GFG25864.1 6-hydroxy-D-nicotine oxidase [Aspergillus udagawae]